MGVAIGTALFLGTPSLCVFTQPSRNLPACVSGGYNGGNFRNWQEVQDVLHVDRGKPFGFENDSDGIACENLAGAPRYSSTPSTTNRPPFGTTNGHRSDSPNLNLSNKAAPIRTLW